MPTEQELREILQPEDSNDGGLIRLWTKDWECAAEVQAEPGENFSDAMRRFVRLLAESGIILTDK